MRLFEHPEFEQAILRAAEHFSERGLRPAIVEKDYYVTKRCGSSLRWAESGSSSRAAQAGLEPDRPLLRGHRHLRRPGGIRAAAGQARHRPRTQGAARCGRGAPGADLPAAREPDDRWVRTFRPLRVPAALRRPRRGGRPGAVESGTASGREPTVTVDLRSLLSEFLLNTGLSLGVEDEGAFPMRLLHFRRTFVEKLFAIHGKVELFRRDARPIGSYARHYYDLMWLSEQGEVSAMLASEEYGAIKDDYHRISTEHFPQTTSSPTG